MAIHDPEELRVECAQCGTTEMFPTKKYTVLGGLTAYGVSTSSLQEEGWNRCDDKQEYCSSCIERIEEEAEEDDSSDDSDMGGKS